MAKESSIGKGPPGLGIIVSGGSEHAEDPHEEHDEKHAMCARIAELLGAKLSSTEEEELCDALAAFIDEHEAEKDEHEGEEDEGDEEEEHTDGGEKY
jgi:hypothetical protein